MSHKPIPPPKAAFGLLPMVVTLGVFVLGSIVHVARLGGIWTAVIAVVAAAMFIGNSSGAAYAESYRLFMYASGLITGTWLTLAGIDHLWRDPQWLIGSLFLGGLFATPPWQRVRITQYRRRVRRAAQEEFEEDDDYVDPEKRRWEETFDKAGLRGLHFVSRDEHPAGFSLRVESQTVTQSALIGRLEGLETVTRYRGESVPLNCLTIEPVLNDQGRALAGQYRLVYDIHDILTDILQMPDEHHPLSVLEAFPIGKYADGSTIYLSLNEVQTMVAGLTGSGKSMLLHVVIHQLSRCPDCVIWFGDMKDGTTAKVWLLAWLRRLMGSPVLDWVAADRFELELMLRACVAIIGGRTRLHTGNRWKVSRRRPAIILILDEIADAVGMTRAPKSAREGRGMSGQDMASMLALIVGKGRSEGVWCIAAGQRNSVSMFGSGDMISQMGQRVAFCGTEASMIGMMFQGEPLAARLALSLVHEGTLVLWRKLGKALSIVKRARAYFLGDNEDLDDAVIRASVLHEDLLGVLDDETAAFARPYGYDSRWDEERLYWLTADRKPLTGLTPAGPAPQHAPMNRTSPAGAAATATMEREVKADPQVGFWQGAAPLSADQAATVPMAPTEPFVPGQANPTNRYDYTWEKNLVLEIIAAHPQGIQFTAVIRKMRERGAKAGVPAINTWMQDYLSVGTIEQPGGERTMWFPPAARKSAD